MHIIAIDEIAFDAQIPYQLPSIDIPGWEDVVSMIVVILAILVRPGFPALAYFGLIIKRHLIAPLEQAQSGDHPC